ncbi:MAG: 50S ribosomal protein L21 [Acidobacteriia bacterium]|nr:50S ribosomal protein L21 [Terriglobia bacterium]
MYAVISSGGKQYRVQPGETIHVERLDAEVGQNVKFDEVLAVKTDTDFRVGTPLVAGASVNGKVVDHGRGDKIIVFRFKRKKQYKKTTGHRQGFTAVKIAEIVA